MKKYSKYNSEIGTIYMTAENDKLDYLVFEEDFKVSNFFVRDDNLHVFKQTKLWLDEYFKGKNPKVDPTLFLLKGTEFQRRVWSILLTIPYGEVITYGNIANIIAKERGIKRMSSQAVGNAVGSNPLSIIIPCHRVVGHNNNLVGYGGGILRKIKLLQIENIDIEKYKMPPKKYFKYNKKEKEYLINNDSILGEVIKSVSNIKRSIENDLFTSLVHSVIGQQISTKAQETIKKRFHGYFYKLTPEKINKTSIETIQQFGLTYKKAFYIKNISQMIVEGELNLKQLSNESDEDIIKVLTKLPGIGKWTAKMILIFSLQRKNVISFDDLAIQKGIKKIYGINTITKEHILELKKKYHPYATIASFYIWFVANE